eukprot:COSAG01_NODE_3131_length_6533_cov_6.407212_2_plen_157_part_00
MEDANARTGWVHAEHGAPTAACTVFAGECLGLWTDGKITAPLHFVDESSQVAAAQATEGAVRHSVCPLLLLRGPLCARAGWFECGLCLLGPDAQWPFFLRAPLHADLAPPNPREKASRGRRRQPSSPVCTHDFVTKQVFGERAWRRPGKGSDKPEF